MSTGYYSLMWSKTFARPNVPSAGPKRAVQLLPLFRKIVVPATGAPFSQRALRTACRMAYGHSDVQIMLVYVMEVPRAFSLAASMPGEEALADNVLDSGAHLVREYGCTASTDVQRGREIADTLLKFVAQNDANLLVLGARPDTVRGVPINLARELYDRAPCPVILDYIAGEFAVASSAELEGETRAESFA